MPRQASNGSQVIHYQTKHCQVCRGRAGVFWSGWYAHSIYCSAQLQREQRRLTRWQANFYEEQARYTRQLAGLPTFPGPETYTPADAPDGTAPLEPTPAKPREDEP